MTDKNYTIHFGVAQESDLATLPEGCFSDGDPWDMWGEYRSEGEPLHVQWHARKDEVFRNVGILLMMHWRTLYQRSGYVENVITTTNRWEWGEQSYEGCISVQSPTRVPDSYVQGLNDGHADDPD